MAVEELADGRIVTLVKTIASDIKAPVEIQGHLTQTVQTHNAVSVAASGSSTSAQSVSCEGFSTVNISIKSDVSHNGRFQILWSYDNVTFNLFELPSGTYIINSGTYGDRFADLPVRAPYFKLYLENQDAGAAHTMSAWAYLKA